MAPLKVMVVGTSKVQGMMLEQQIGRLLEGKLLHIAKVLPSYYLDLDIPVCLSSKF